MKENYIYGRNAVLEALKSEAELEKIYILYGTQGDSINKIFSSAKKNDIRCTTLDKRKFAELEEKAGIPQAKSQGVIAIVALIKTVELHELIELSLMNKTQPVLVALDEITDPQNLGAIARSAECAGAEGIIITERNSAPINSIAIKASAGALEHIQIAKVHNLNQALEKCKEAGYWIVGTDSEAETIYTDSIYDRPVVLIIGSEGKGIRHSIKNVCDYLVKIPLLGKISSLNASVSAAVILFEMLKQRSKTL